MPAWTARKTSASIRSDMGRPDLTAPLRAKLQKIGRVMRQRQVCHFPEEPFNSNGRLYSSLPIYHFDLKGKYQFNPKYHWLPFFV